MADFLFKPFNEMTPKDYAEVGFMSGLEVHQQLLTERKLFCRCPAGKYSTEYHAEILRHMRPTLSELGEYDGTALMEFKTKKDIIYRINHETVCTYEMDDTPPFEMNEQALDISIEIGLLLNSNIVDEIHIARKQYLDGSIPTGFQRTAIICVNGEIPYKGRKIGVIQMSLEEDSCREESDIGHRRVYNTDRLGMPLIETVTAPDMKTPFEVAEVNELIRRIARSTGKVRTGIGAGREDVNVSVRGGTRIEIKGVPRIKSIPLLTYNEAMRQWNLLRLREELRNRGITLKTFKSDTADVTKLLRKTRFQPIYNAIGEGKVVKCVNLRGFKGLLRWQTQIDTYFANEISDRVRVIACLTTLPNIINSDSNLDAISSSDGQKIRKMIGATDDDTLVLVWGNEEDTRTATNEIIIRAKEATIGIPSETRQAFADGTNGFERILPGADRMYPDTDLPPKKITDERVQGIKLNLQEPFWNREKWYEELNIPKDVVKTLSTSNYANLFQKLVNEMNIDPTLASVVLIQFPKRLTKMKLNTSSLNEEVFTKIFELYKDGKILKDGIFSVLDKFVKGEGPIEDLIPQPLTDKEFESIFEKCISILNHTKLKNKEKVNEYFIGLMMSELRGRIDGSKLSAILSENPLEVK